MRLLLATIFTLGLASAAQAKGALCDGSIIAGVCKEVKKNLLVIRVLDAPEHDQNGTEKTQLKSQTKTTIRPGGVLLPALSTQWGGSVRYPISHLRWHPNPACGGRCFLAALT